MLNSLALTVDSAGHISGTMLANSATPTCAFSVTAAYSAASLQIAGSYAATSGCTGQTGTFNLTATCTDEPSAVDRRRMGGIAHC